MKEWWDWAEPKLPVLCIYGVVILFIFGGACGL